MGTNCSDHPGPDTTNICSDAVGNIYQGRHFCTLAGSHDDYRRSYCNNLSDGEWSFNGPGSTCQYNDCDEQTDFGGGCCGVCCGIVGQGVKCRREAFLADNLLCCLRDLACHPVSSGGDVNPYCFEDDRMKKTCDPGYRDQAGTQCQALLMDYCTGADVAPGQSQIWIDRWLGDQSFTTTAPDGSPSSTQVFSQPCYRAVYRNLYNHQAGQCVGAPGVGYPDSAGYIWAQTLMNNMITRYQQDGGSLDATESSEGNNQLNAMIWGICNTTPGLCQKSINQYCATTTNNSLIRNVSLVPWCGCYMPAEQYSKYTDLYQISRECTPTCNSSGVLPLPTDDGIDRKLCKQTTCVIDDVSIQIAQSQVGGSGTGVQFSQLCSSCAGAGANASCTCTLTGLTLSIVASEIGNVSVSQQCGASSNCYSETTAPDGSVQSIQVPCNSSGSATEDNPYADIQAQSAVNQANAIQDRNIRIFGLIVAAILLIIVIWLILSPITPPDSDVIVTIPGPPLPSPPAVDVARVLPSAITTSPVTGTQVLYLTPASRLIPSGPYSPVAPGSGESGYSPLSTGFVDYNATTYDTTDANWLTVT